MPRHAGTLEGYGILRLPPRREESVRDAGAADRPAWTSAPDPGPETAAPPAELRPLKLEAVADAEGRHLWNAFVDRHHHLGYRRPFGAHVRHFVTDRQGRRLGCLLSGAAAKSLPCGDRWIGWSDRVRGRRRHLMVVNSRFLVFPWVVSKNLASPVPGMAARRLPDGRERLHGWRPVLRGTLKDGTRFRASCQRAASRERVGGTAAGRGKPVKGVHVMPLDPACRGILRGGREAAGPKPPARAGRGRSAASDRRSGRRFGTPGAAATSVAARGDARWRKRRRVLDSLPVMPVVLRPVAAPRGQGYRTTLCGPWARCAAAGVAPPQAEPPAASTACAARDRPAGAAFRRPRAGILASAPDPTPWKGRRVLAVDGWRTALPREAAARGFRVADGAHHAQGMVSVPCRLRGRIPVDLHLPGHGNGRLAALTHPGRAAEGDVTVHHRGYRSFAMALAHAERGPGSVFRPRKAAGPVSDAFIAPSGTDRTVTPGAPRDGPSLRGRTLRVRRVRYTAGDTGYRLATSLPDSRRHRIQPLPDLHHGRWGTGEMYRTGKSATGWFHAKSVRGVRQEPCAALTRVRLSAPVSLARRQGSASSRVSLLRFRPARGGVPGVAPAITVTKAPAPGVPGPVRSLRHPLPTLHGARCHAPCRARFRPAGRAFAGREPDPPDHGERFQVILSSFPGPGLAQCGSRMVSFGASLAFLPRITRRARPAPPGGSRWRIAAASRCRGGPRPATARPRP